MIKEAIQKVSQKEDLPYEEAEAVMDEIMSGQANGRISNHAFHERRNY